MYSVCMCIFICIYRKQIWHIGVTSTIIYLIYINIYSVSCAGNQLPKLKWPTCDIRLYIYIYMYRPCCDICLHLCENNKKKVVAIYASSHAKTIKKARQSMHLRRHPEISGFIFEAKFRVFFFLFLALTISGLDCNFHYNQACSCWGADASRIMACQFRAPSNPPYIPAI